jgi:hypothetical protein
VLSRAQARSATLTISQKGICRAISACSQCRLFSTSNGILAGSLSMVARMGCGAETAFRSAVSPPSKCDNVLDCGAQFSPWAASACQPPAQRFVGYPAEGPAAAARLWPRHRLHGDHRRHTLALLRRHHDFNALRRMLSIGRWTCTQPRQRRDIVQRQCIGRGWDRFWRRARGSLVDGVS